MFVTKRNGTREPVQFDKISSRLKTLCARIPNTPVDVTRVAQSVIAGIYDGVSTSDLDILAAETSASFASQHTDYAALAGYIAVSNLHKETPSSFLASMTVLHGYINTETNRSAPMISDSIYDIVCENIDLFENAIDYERDYNFNYFGFKTLERSYLLKVNDKVLERPQSMYMRVALGIHGNDLESVLSTYDSLSHGIISHASPTLFSSGTPKPQLSSCFLLKISEDSISGIFDTLGECARISKGINMSFIYTMIEIFILGWLNGIMFGLLLPFAISGFNYEYQFDYIELSCISVRPALILFFLLLSIFLYL